MIEMSREFLSLSYANRSEFRTILNKLALPAGRDHASLAEDVTVR